MSPAIARCARITRAVLTWWLGELAGFVPKRLRRGNLVVVLGSAEISLCHETSGEMRTMARIDRQTSKLHQEVAAALGRAGLSWRRLAVCLRLPAESALRDTIRLPLAAEGNLREVVSFELDRHTPFNAAEVYFAHRLVSRDARARRLQVELTVVPRGLVEAALASCRELGIAPDRVEIEGASAELPAMALRPHDDRPVVRSAGWRANLALATLAAALAGIAIYLPHWAVELRRETLASQLAEVKKTSAEVARVEGEIDGLREDGTFLVNRKRKPNVSRILAEVTRVMSDETWLVEFQLSAAEVQLAGFSASASDLIGFLEQTPIFRNTAFRSPVTQDPASRRERFHIAARVVAETEK
jgi:general secretion pathway protein L